MNKKKPAKRGPKVVYVVTTLRFGYKYLNAKRSADGIYHSYRKRTYPTQRKYFTIKSIRTWGWYSDLKTAKQCVEENWADIYEGDYDCAIIEEIAEGILHGCEIPKEWWYKWRGSWEKGGYKPWKKPKEYNNIIGFMKRMKGIRAHGSDAESDG